MCTQNVFVCLLLLACVCAHRWMAHRSHVLMLVRVCVCVWKVSSLIASGRRLYQIVIICILLFAATLKWFAITLARRVRLILVLLMLWFYFTCSHTGTFIWWRGEKKKYVNASLLPVSDMMKMLKIFGSAASCDKWRRLHFLSALSTVLRAEFMVELISL